VEYDYNAILDDVKLNGCSCNTLMDYCKNYDETDKDGIDSVRKIIYQFIESSAQRPPEEIYVFLAKSSNEEQCKNDVDLMMALIDIRRRSNENGDYELGCINNLLQKYPLEVIPHICYSGYGSTLIKGLKKNKELDVQKDLDQILKIFSSINYVINNQKGKDSPYYDILLYDDRLFKNVIEALQSYTDGNDHPEIQLWLLYEIQVFLKKSIDSTTLFNKVVEDYSAELLKLCLERGEDLSKIPSVLTCMPGSKDPHYHDGEWIIASVLHHLSVKYRRNHPDLFQDIIEVEHSRIIRDVTDLNIAIRLNKDRSSDQMKQIRDYFRKNPNLLDKIKDRINVENEDWMQSPTGGYAPLLAKGNDPATEKARLEVICDIFKNKTAVKEEHLSLLLSIMETSLQTEGIDLSCIESCINSLDLLLKHTIDIDFCASNTTISILAVLEVAYRLLPRDTRINVDGTLIDHLNEVLDTGLDYLFTPTLRVLKILSGRGTSKLETVFAICRGTRYLDIRYDEPAFEKIIIKGLSDPEARLYASEFMSDIFHKSMLPDYSEKDNVIDTLMWMLCDGTKKVKDNSIDALMNILQRTSIESRRCMKIMEWLYFDTNPERNAAQCKLIYYMYKSRSIDDFKEFNSKLVKEILIPAITTEGQENSVFWAANVFNEMPIDNPALSIDTVIQLLEVANNPWSEDIDDISISQLFEAVHHIGKILEKTDDGKMRKRIRLLLKGLIAKEYHSTKGIFNSFGRMLSTLAEADLWRDSDADDDYPISDAIYDCVNILSTEDNTAVMYWVLRCLSKLIDELAKKDHMLAESNVDVVSKTLFGMMELRNKFSRVGGCEDYGVRAQISIVIRKSFTMSKKYQLFSDGDPRLIGIWDTEGDASWEVQKNTAINTEAYTSRFEKFDYGRIREVLTLFNDEKNHNFIAGDLRFGLKFATKIFSNKEFAKEPNSRKDVMNMTLDIINLLRGQMELYRTYMSTGIKKEYSVDDKVPGYVINLFDYGIIAEICKTLHEAAVRFNSMELLSLVNDHGLIALLNRIVKDIPDYGTVKHTLRVLDELAEKGLYSGSTVQVIREKLLTRHNNHTNDMCNDYGVMISAIKTLANILTNVTDEKSDTLMPLMDDSVIHLNIFRSALATFDEDGNMRYWVLRCLMPLAKCCANLDMEDMIDEFIRMSLSNNSAIRRMSSTLIGYGFDTAKGEISEMFQDKLSSEYSKIPEDDLSRILRMLNSLSILTGNTFKDLDSRFDFTYLLNKYTGESRKKLLENISLIDSSELSIRGADQTLTDIVNELVNDDGKEQLSPSKADMVLFDCVKTIMDSKMCSETCLDKNLPLLSTAIDDYVEYIGEIVNKNTLNILRGIVPGCPGYDYYRALETISTCYLSCLAAKGNAPFQKRNPLKNYLALMEKLPKRAENESETKQLISLRVLLSKVVVQTVNYEVYSERLEDRVWERISNNVLDNIGFDNNICKYNSLATLYVAQAVLKKGSLYDDIIRKTVRAIDDYDLICYQENMSVARLSSHVLRRFARNGMLDVLFFDNLRSLMENNIESSMNEAMDMIPVLEVLSSTFIHLLKDCINNEEKGMIRGLNIMQYNDLKRSLVAASYILSTASYKRSSRSDEGIRHMAARISSRTRVLNSFEQKPKYAIPIMKYMTERAKTKEMEIKDNSEPLEAVNQAHMIVYTFPNIISSSEEGTVPSIITLISILDQVSDRYDGLLSLVNMGRITQIKSSNLKGLMEALITSFKKKNTKQEYELLSQCINNLSNVNVRLEPEFIDTYVLDRLKNHTMFFSSANNIFSAMNHWSDKNVAKPHHYAEMIELLTTQCGLSTLYINLSDTLANVRGYFNNCYDSTDLQSISKLIDNIIPVLHRGFLPSRGYENKPDNLTLVQAALTAIEQIFNQTEIGLSCDDSLTLLREYISTDLETAIRIFLVTDLDFSDNKNMVSEYDAILSRFGERREHYSPNILQGMLRLIAKMCQLNILNGSAMPILEAGIKDERVDIKVRLLALDAMLISVKNGHKPRDIYALEDFLSSAMVSENNDERHAFRTKVALILHNCLTETERIKILDRETMANIDLYVKDDYNHGQVNSKWMKFSKK